MPKQTILIDFDGVIHDYKGWAGPESLNLPMPNSRAAMYLLARIYHLVCFTTRPRQYVEPWLLLHGFPVMKVTNIKEPAFLLIDDRALTFTGAWNNDFISRITSFSPHWMNAVDHPETQCPSESEPSHSEGSSHPPPLKGA